MFPTLSQYNRSIQQQGSSAFRTLTNLFFIPAKTLPIKIYSFGSGSFAVVFKALENGKDVAIRCFIGTDDDYVERYRKIDNYLKNIDESWKTNIQFLDNEIKVEEKYYPVLKMDWVDGELLDKFISKNLNNELILTKLQKEIVKTSKNLERNSIAHGDIQCGNIIIEEINGNPKVRLIDYDGLYIPSFSGDKQKERGRSEFQHPNRANFEFNEKIDRFSFWVILCALEALKFDKTLWKEIMEGGYNTLDNMLFVGSDFSNPIHSKLFQRLSNLNQPSLNFYIDSIKLALYSYEVKEINIYDDLGNKKGNKIPADEIETPRTTNSPNANEYKRLKIESTPNGATVKNKDFVTIGSTPLSLNKYSYLNEEVKIIFGTKVKTILVNDSVKDIFINFDEIIKKDNNPQPIVAPIEPTPAPPTALPKKDYSAVVIISSVFLVMVIIIIIISKQNNSSTDHYALDNASAIDSAFVVIDSAAVVTDSVAMVVDSATEFVNSDTEPTVISSPDVENIEKIREFNGGYIIDKIEEYEFDVNSSKWILNNTENYGELFLDNYNISFMRPSSNEWRYSEWEYEAFDKENNNYILNDNHNQKIIISTDFKKVTWLSNYKNSNYLNGYIYYILKKSNLVNPS